MSCISTPEACLLIRHDRAPPSQQPSPTDRTVPVLDKSDKTTASQLLSQGVPFVVNNVQLRGTYDPKYFINKYYGNPCRIHLVESGTTKETTVDEFFRTFGHLRAPEARAKLKVNHSALRSCSPYFIHFHLLCVRIGLLRNIFAQNLQNSMTPSWQLSHSRIQ